MAAKFFWTGLEELKAQLRTLAPRLVEQGLKLAQAEANAAAVQIRSNYAAHRQTGRLQASVSVSSRVSGRTYVARADVRAGARHAAWFEFGTAGKVRYTTTGGSRGVLPPAPPLHAFFPVIFRHRRILFGQLGALLAREGLTPRGLADAA
jgi:Bacteriophage HK97-gp10, putative tail-component